MFSKSILATALGALVALGSVSTAHAAAPSFTCEASALRGTVLGQAVEPVTYGRGTPCRTGQAVPSVALPQLLDASVLAAGGTLGTDAAKPTASAAGGLVGARVKLLPDVLPITLPLDQVLANVQPVSVPLPLGGLLGLPAAITVDIRAALRAIAPNGVLPQADLLSTGVVSSIAAASCVDGRLAVDGSSTITGLKVLGIDVGSGIDKPLQQNLAVVDSANLDPSNIDLSKVVITTPGIDLGLPGVLAAVQGALQPVLDALPTIQVPAAVASVKVTPNQQIREGLTLTQRALRVEASLLGQPLVDLVVGEAKVSAAGDCPGAAAPPTTPSSGVPAELQCTDRKLVLLDVYERRGRVFLRGAAARTLVGKTVDIKYRAQGNRVVARAKVRSNGSFETTAPLPGRALRASNLSRYTAVRGDDRSLPLKLVRRMRTATVEQVGGLVRIRGRISGPLATPVADVRIIRRVACGKAQLVKRFKPNRDGTFVVHVKASSKPAVYRLATSVRKTTRNPRTYPTFTLPRGIDLDQR